MLTAAQAGSAPDVAVRARPAAESVVSSVIRLHEALAAMPDLAPCPAVDALFGDLVHTCLAGNSRTASTVLADPRVRRIAADLAAVCADGEAALEDHWAATVLAAADPVAALAGFPYLDNYERLVRLEIGALAAAGQDVAALRRICFVGGGPLPLSALALHRSTSARVTVVDNDPRAVGRARGVLDRLAPPGAVDVRCADALTGEGMAAALERGDAVVLAALVGRTPADKRGVLKTVARLLPPGARVVARSADGLRSLLYPVVDVADVTEAGLVPELLVHPLGDVVNSVLVARRG
ncbi:MAG: nicotianamine synthase family protein [Angustibacter sp.]